MSAMKQVRAICNLNMQCNIGLDKIVLIAALHNNNLAPK